LSLSGKQQRYGRGSLVLVVRRMPGKRREETKKGKKMNQIRIIKFKDWDEYLTKVNELSLKEGLEPVLILEKGYFGRGLKDEHTLLMKYNK